MRRRRRWFSIIALFPLVAACALIRGGTPATDPDPKQYPCGLDGVICEDTMPRSCCAKYGECRSDDDGPFCQYNVPEDPSDPTMLRRKPKRGPRLDIRH